jgi:PAS domain S-box-containing protein
MQIDETSTERSRRLLLAAALVVLYVVVGLSFASINAKASPVWPAAGLALAACVLVGYGMWPAIFLGAFITNATTAGSLGTSLVIAGGNTLEALVGAFVVNQLAGGRRVFERVPDIFKFAIGAALVSTALSATVGVTVLSLTGYAPWAEYGTVWVTWWLGDAAGDLVVAPLVILWAIRPVVEWKSVRVVEAALALIAVVVVGGLVFAAPGLSQYRPPFLCIAPLLWIALRFGARELATGVALLSILATAATAHGRGPFATSSPNDSLLLLEVFLVALVLMMLPVAALVRERRRIVDEREGLLDTARRERARAQAAHEARSRLVAIVEGSDDAIISKTLDGTITSWNPAATRMFGHTEAEAIGQRITLIIPPDRLEQEEAVLARLRRGEHIAYFETDRVTKEGRLVQVSVTVSPIRNDAGEIVGASKIVRDLTVQRRGERARERLQRQADALAQTARTLTETLDPATVAQRVVEGVREVLEATSSILRLREPDGSLRCVALAGKQLEGVAPGYLLPAGVGMVARAMRERRAVWTPDIQGEGEVVLSDDFRHRLVAAGHRAVIAVPLQAGGEIIGTLSLAYSGIRTFTSAEVMTLQTFADQAALAIRNGQLFAREQRARAESEAANRAKDEFLAILSHELRTPLTSVLGWARMLASSQLDAGRMRHAVEAIERNARLQAQLIDDLLDISRIVVGKLQLDLRPVDLVPIIEHAVETPARHAAAKGVRLHCVLDPAASPVMGDALRVQQVVANLVGNAVKFTPEGGSVEVRLERQDGTARIAVVDTGIGIAAEVLPHVFERFRQGDSSTTRQHGGLGLGLAIVRNLVELHGGGVRASSEGIGRGSTFEVRLPIVALARRLGSRDVLYDAAPFQPERDLERVRVLVVEDDADARQLFATALAERGAEVEMAGGVDEALQAIGRRPVHALVTDIGMPGRDGYDLIAAFRAMSPDHRLVPAIAVTAMTTQEDRARALAAGFQMHLPKPIDPTELASLVARAVGRAA